MKRTIRITGRNGAWRYGGKLVACNITDFGLPDIQFKDAAVKMTVADRPFSGGIRLELADDAFVGRRIESMDLITCSVDGRGIDVEGDAILALRKLLRKPKGGVFYFRVESGQAPR